MAYKCWFQVHLKGGPASSHVFFFFFQSHWNVFQGVLLHLKRLVMGNIRLFFFFSSRDDGEAGGHGDTSTLLRVINLRASAVFFFLFEPAGEAKWKRPSCAACRSLRLWPRSFHPSQREPHSQWADSRRQVEVFFSSQTIVLKKKAYTATNIFSSNHIIKNICLTEGYPQLYPSHIFERRANALFFVSYHSFECIMFWFNSLPSLLFDTSFCFSVSQDRTRQEAHESPLVINTGAIRS